MKKTNVAFMHVASRLLKVLPVLLCIFLLSSSNLAAQDFLPKDEAMLEVKTELTEMTHPSQLEVTSTMDADDLEDQLTARAYEQFLVEARTASSTEAAYEIMEGHLNVNKMKEPRKSVAENVLESLLELITE